MHSMFPQPLRQVLLHRLQLSKKNEILQRKTLNFFKRNFSEKKHSVFYLAFMIRKKMTYSG